MGFFNDFFGFEKRRIEKERIRAEQSRVDRQVERESFPTAGRGSAGRVSNRPPQARASHRTDSSPSRNSESSASRPDDFILTQSTLHSSSSHYSPSCGSESNNASSSASDSSSSSSCDSSSSGD